MRRIELMGAVVLVALAGCRRQPARAHAGGSSADAGGSSAGGTGGSTSGGSTAGTSGTSGTTSCPGGFDSLALDPANTAETIQNGQAADIAFTVQGMRNGAATPVDPSALRWTAARADDTDPGAVVNGVFHPFTGAGGVVTVTAEGCGASGTATVTLRLDYQAQGGADGGASAGDFTGAEIADGGGGVNAPKIVYPSDQTRFPRNIYKVLFQWNKNGSSLFRITFTGAGSTVQVYTDGSDPACAAIANAGCWEADSATWNAIAGSNAGGTVTLEVAGTAAPGSTVYASTAETLGFSRRDVKGAIFYWAANVGGIQRATVSDAAPESYLVGAQMGAPTVLPSGDSVSCAACHTLSRDGKKLAATGSATGPVAMPKGLWVLDVTPAPPPNPAQTSFADARGDGYAAFSPDDAKLVWSPRNGGTLELLDAIDGGTISSVSVNGQAVTGTAPDWSPRTGVGEIAYADPTGGISRVTYDGTQFDGPQLLAPKIAGKANGFPSYSPTGNWIAFTNNNTALYLVPADGGTPVDLAAANTAVNNATAAPSENSMPTWAPPGDLDWVAFNSQRPYGLVTSGGTNQIWVAAVDFARLDGGDPSYPAFRLPFQELTAKNHRAFWVQDVRDYPDGGAFQKDGGNGSDGGASDAGTGIADAGAPPDAGACVATGSGCDPATSVCCDQATSGAYCGPDGNGSNVCQAPVFR